MRLNCSDWILLSVCIGQSKTDIVRRIYDQGWRWFFGPRKSNFEGGSRGRAPVGGLGAKSPEAEETLQIVHVRKVFFVYNTWYQSEHID